MRVTTQLWVSAYLRTRNDNGFPTVLIRRGAREAGAVFVRVDRLDGTIDLYQPASQLSYADSHLERGARLFVDMLQKATVFEVMDKLEAEEKFDSDFWVIETEAADGSHGLELVEA